MPVEISHENQGYRIKFKEPTMGRGYNTFARDVSEICATIEHYYGSKNPNHHNGKGVRKCPLCRSLKG